jgi:hypothetical protein
MTTRLGSILALGLVACASEVAPRSEAVQLDQLGEGFYSLALAEPGALGDATRASGTVFVPQLDAGGEPQTGPGGVAIRGTCGVTFVSPEYAVTAAHCVDDHDVPFPESAHPLIVQTYQLDDPNWLPSTNVSGVFPNFHHPAITTGYHVESHTCTVVRRCGGHLYGQLDCDLEDADTALLHCPSAPGCKAGFLDVAALDDLEAPPQMVWSHEIYDVPASGSLHDHYTFYDGDKADNYHYFGDGRNQLLQLVSRSWLAGDLSTAHVKLSHDLVSGITWTDLLSCNGTSGSGVLQHDGNDLDLLGPISRAWNKPDVLCRDRDLYEPGDKLVSYSMLGTTQAAVEGIYHLGESCDELSDDPTRPGPWRDAHRIPLDDLVQVPDWPWTWPCTDCSPWEQVRLHDEPMIELPRGGRVTFPGQSFGNGRSYRFSLRVVPPATGASNVNVRIGGSAFLTRARPTVTGSERAGVITGTFTATSGGAHDLVIENDASSGGTLHVTEIALARNGLTNGFERYDLRGGVGLISPRVEGGRLVPMRFTGDGRGGYAARLEGGERMLLTREALAPGRTYAISFTGDRDQTLGCRLLLGDGAVVSSACDVRSGRASVSLAAPAGVTPIAIAIDSPAGGARVDLDDVVIR